MSTVDFAIALIYNDIMIDTHTHCYHSQDSRAPARDMIEGAIAKGLQYIALTDHYDLDMLGFPQVPQIDLPRHFEELTILKEQYKGKIQLAIGIECGWAKDVQDDYARNLAPYKLDMTINSVHMIDGKDCYAEGYYDDLPMDKCYDDYLNSVIDSLSAPYRFDSIGHLGYIMRKAPYPDPIMKYTQFGDKLDHILRTIIDKGVALEVNTHTKNLPIRCLPTIEILTRYREMGGELLTFGSDAHQPIRLADKYDETMERLKVLGYKYIFKYLSHEPIAHKI